MSFSLLIQIVIVLLVCGMLLWCIERIPGLPSVIKTVVQIVAVLLFAVWLLSMGGLVHAP